MIYQPAHEHYIQVHDHITAGNERRGLSPKKVFAEASYVSAEYIKNYRDRGQELMGYMRGFAGREKAFKTEALKVDFENRFTLIVAPVW